MAAAQSKCLHVGGRDGCLLRHVMLLRVVVA
jgi:hypothetical protein